MPPAPGGDGIKRDKVQTDIMLVLGMVEIYPDQKATLSGFKDEIDREKWLIEEAQHSIDGSGGFTTKVILEVAG